MQAVARCEQVVKHWCKSGQAQECKCKGHTVQWLGRRQTRLTFRATANTPTSERRQTLAPRRARAGAREGERAPRRARADEGNFYGRAQAVTHRDLGKRFIRAERSQRSGRALAARAVQKRSAQALARPQASSRASARAQSSSR
jgi:hypothetical protein